MADQSDVETALTSLVASALYPQGTSQPSIVGDICRIYRGWPNAAALDADLAAGRINVTVFPEAGSQRNTTRYPTDPVIPAAVTPSLAVTVSGNTATFSGIASPGQIAGLMAHGRASVHRTTANDTPALVAAILAAGLRNPGIVLLSGATVTVPGAELLVGRVVADQPSFSELRRQQQSFRLTAWCPTPATRDIVAAAIDTALSAHTFIAFADGSAGRLRFAASTVFDQSQDAALYRRDIVYSVEYATTFVADLPCLLFGNTTLAPNGAGITQNLLG